MKQFLSIVTLAVSLSACSANHVDAPSLQMRPIETKAIGTTAEPTVKPPALAPSDANRVSIIEGLSNRVNIANRDFKREIGVAQSSIRGGVAQGSDGWVAGQMALARAEAMRAPIKAALTELDEQLGQILLGPASADEDMVRNALDSVAAIDTEQQRALDALYVKLGN